MLDSYYDNPMTGGSIGGEPVTSAMIEAWASEAERGYPVDGLRKRGRRPLGNGPSAVVPVRIDEALLEALTTRAERDHISRSEAIRAAVRAWVDVA